MFIMNPNLSILRKHNTIYGLPWKKFLRFSQSIGRCILFLRNLYVKNFLEHVTYITILKIRIIICRCII